MKAWWALAASLALASCAGGAGPGSGGEQRLKPVASPSDVVAVELAMARTAREEGHWTGLREFAADGAVILRPDGAFEAKPWLGKQASPAEPLGWQPLAVWSSCDGSLAVSQVSYARPTGSRPSLGHTVWQRERNGDYRWVFHLDWPTGTAPREPEMIAAKVAQCGPAIAVPGEEPGLRRSTDGSLAWSFGYVGDGTRNFTVWTAGAGGTMIPVVQVTIPPPT